MEPAAPLDTRCEVKRECSRRTQQNICSCGTAVPNNCPGTFVWATSNGGHPDRKLSQASHIVYAVFLLQPPENSKHRFGRFAGREVDGTVGDKNDAAAALETDAFKIIVKMWNTIQPIRSTSITTVTQV